MPAHVRKQPLIERIKSTLNVFDFLLWLSEEVESRGWDQLEKEWALPIGVVTNVLFLISRATASNSSKHYDDVFGESTGPGWGTTVSVFVTHLLSWLCVLNTLYTFTRKRHYRLFEAPVDVVPSTPSAHRVKLNSSPMSSSPLRFISTVLGTESAHSRAHPDPTQDIWEIAVWDPLPISLRLFCYFSPGHAILYWLFLPTMSADPRPSTTVATTIILGLLLSVQLSFMSSSFSQQTKDSALISKEVMNEYDTKFVRPRTQPFYRDVATQFSTEASHSLAREEKYNKVVTFLPAFVHNRTFKTNPNPNYVQKSDGSSGVEPVPSRPSVATPDFRSPPSRNDFSSPIRPQTAIRQPQLRPSAGTGAGGGSLGVYSHAASPLRKSASTNFSPTKGQYLNDVANSRGSLSPEKRRSTPAGGLVNTQVASHRWGHLQSEKARRESGRF